MSFDALAWAAKQDTGSSGTKLVLLGLAECADRSHNLAFPSIAALVQFSSLNRKSVMSNLDKLEASGLIADTGRRVGATKQIKVYQLMVPNLEQSQIRNSSVFSDNSPKNGTRNQSEPVNTGAKAPYEAVADLWNSLSPVSGIPEIRVFNNSRKQMLNARVKEHGLEAILTGVRSLHASAFCQGKSGDGRKQDIMLLLQPKTCARLLEGFYNQDVAPAPKQYVSASGYRYRGDRDAVKRQAEKRRDLDTYWTICGEERAEREARSVGDIVSGIVGRAA